MASIILPMKKAAAEKILRGEVKADARRRLTSRVEAGDWVYMYATTPTKKLLGRFKVSSIHRTVVQELVEKFGDLLGNGVGRSKLASAKDGTEVAIMGIESPMRAEAPTDLRDIDMYPPQESTVLTSFDELVIKYKLWPGINWEAEEESLRRRECQN